MKNSKDMATGELVKVTENLNVSADRQSTVMVDPGNLMAQGESKARQDTMNLTSSGKMMKPSNRDTYQ